MAFLVLRGNDEHCSGKLTKKNVTWKLKQNGKQGISSHEVENGWIPLLGTKKLNELYLWILVLMNSILPYKLVQVRSNATVNLFHILYY